MDIEKIRQLLIRIQEGSTSPAQALETLKDLPYQDIGVAVIDHHRTLRSGQPEVVFGKDKSIDELCAIANAIIEKQANLLITKITAEQAAAILPLHRALRHNERAGLIVGEFAPQEHIGLVAVVSAGTSDLPVVEEAAETLELLGNRVERVVDVGVAGIHRLFGKLDIIRKANVVIVAAGMEGALASVVGGLTGSNVIAVPTSVGYGASFGGLAALLGMLNSCSPNVSVVNIDNGFAAGFNASIINRAIAHAR
jgi:hypothetical protein